MRQVYVHGGYTPGVQVFKCTGCTSGYEMCTRCMYTVYIFQVYKCPDVLGALVGSRSVQGVCRRCTYTRCTRCPDVLGAPVGTRCVPGVCIRCICNRCIRCPDVPGALVGTMCTGCLYTVYIYQAYRCPDKLGAPVGTRCVPVYCMYTVYICQLY